MDAQLIELANHLHKSFATDQSSYALQQDDGSYRRTTGVVTPKLLEKNLANAGSVAVYQKNSDQTVKWICYDFDILKKNLDTDFREQAEEELQRTISGFCDKLSAYDIPFLLEFSGNRGFHVWITFGENTDYGSAYLILETILKKATLSFNHELITIDKFPSSRSPSGGVGKAVKIPVSKHKKSGAYSLLIKSKSSNYYSGITQLNNEILSEQISLLSSHRSITKSELERLLEEIFPVSISEHKEYHRIKNITASTTKLSIEVFIEHWQVHPPLAELAKGLAGALQLEHEKRKLLVGMLVNLRCEGSNKAGRQFIHEILKKQDNYNHDFTEKAITSLSSYNFPSQEQIEEVTLKKFNEKFTTDSLLKACIPSLDSYEEAILDIELKDVEVAKISELNYLYLNDEVHIPLIIDELSSRSASEMYTLAVQIIDQKSPPVFYKHIRLEKKQKERLLVTPDAATRVATSCILKQLLYFLDYQPSQNSYGYRANRGFQGGYIFKPWLYMWIKFVSNISSAIQEESNKNYYIVKTDILSFYDKVPHDNLKRLLLGGVNKKIDSKIETLNTESFETYKTYIDVLFRITEKMVSSKKGLPQGPAYARYLAELYLANLDEQFDAMLKNGELYLYQRYVDDIFFIAPTEETARNTLDSLKRSLELIGLSINSDKTIVSEICNFSDNFNSYRAQSKYAVDRASRNFSSATETQQNLAINEFMELVQSDSCAEDLAFVFSHLDGVAEVNPVKKDLVLPTINSGIGRGSLYRHLFSFVLRHPDNWSMLDQIVSFTKLQSEVLTSVLIAETEENEREHLSWHRLINSLMPKLQSTKVVEENIAFLCLTYEFDVTTLLKNIFISPEAFISCLKVKNKGEALVVHSALLTHINTSLNDIKGLDEFSRIMYALCSSKFLTPENLNDLAITFYAKLSSEYNTGELNAPDSSTIKDAETAWRFYSLLCLFSLSDANTSTDLLTSMWKFCAGLCNSYGLPQILSGQPNWFAKIGSIKRHLEKTQFVISSIVDGNIFRGSKDKCQVFERFHNNLLIYLALEENSNNTENIEEALKQLQSRSTFYHWLAHRKDVRLFPNHSNRSWFERNVMENGTIILRKGNQVLFHKPRKDFHPDSNPTEPHNGYSELVEDYHPNKLSSLRENIESLDIKPLLDLILEATISSQEIGRFPNVFVNEKLLEKDSLNPFSKELLVSRKLIFEDVQQRARVFTCSAREFISCCLLVHSGRNSSKVRRIDEKYLAKLATPDDVTSFLINVAEQLDSSDDFYIDLFAASSLSLMLQSLEPMKRIEKFVEIYHNFNKEFDEQHIYGVSKEQKPNDLNPMILIETIVYSLKAIRTNTLQSLAFFLDNDVNTFRDSLLNIAEKTQKGNDDKYLQHFRRANVKLYHTSGTISVDSKSWAFKDVRLLNHSTKELVVFETGYSTLINSSEHVYWREINETVHLLAIPHAFSKMYRSIELRYENIKKDGRSKSFPESCSNIDSIKGLSNFNEAVKVVATQRSMSRQDSESQLIQWLRHLPDIFHSPLVNLIAGHEVMDEEEMNIFVSVVWNAWNDKTTMNPFLLKRLGDHSGTHRVLQRDNNLGRILEELKLTPVQQDAKIITLIIDNIISGSQTVKALRYYCGKSSEQVRPSDGYYETTSDEQNHFFNVLRSIEQINICCVLYTNMAIKKLEEFLNDKIESKAIIKIINGRDISDNAFFNTSTRISENDKEKIRQLLCEDKSAARLQKLLSGSNQTNPKRIVPKDIENINLVARYNSMPKKGFLFLTQGLKSSPKCCPFVRVRETYEMS